MIRNLGLNQICEIFLQRYQSIRRVIDIEFFRVLGGTSSLLRFYKANDNTCLVHWLFLTNQIKRSSKPREIEPSKLLFQVQIINDPKVKMQAFKLIVLLITMRYWCVSTGFQIELHGQKSKDLFSCFDVRHLRVSKTS